MKKRMKIVAPGKSFAMHRRGQEVHLTNINTPHFSTRNALIAS
ncbi:hypothetical protein [Mediterranea massiliensis]